MTAAYVESHEKQTSTDIGSDKGDQWSPKGGLKESTNQYRSTYVTGEVA